MATLAVIGAGPKALAVAAKRDALAALGFAAPDVVLVDPDGVGAHWTGAHGYTDGRRPLGTPPEKDVGFPYAQSWGAHSTAVTGAMRAVSWAGFLLEHHRFADWVDRGRPRPTHADWAAYLSWVAERVAPDVRRFAVRSLENADGRWRLTGDDERDTLEADAVVVTGPGPARRIAGEGDGDPRILDGRSFWTQCRHLGKHGPLEVAVVGSGETAASIVAALVDELKPGSRVEVITSTGVIYTRGEGWAENRLYSQPEPDWARMSDRHRREFLRRTDRGVFSVQAESVLDFAQGVQPAAGTVRRLRRAGEKVLVELAYENEREELAFDLVVVAVGFRADWWRAQLGPRARAALEATLRRSDDGDDDGARPRSLEHAIGHDLAVEGLQPRLHLPALAGLRQGPGFPNLSCLGLGADRILGAHVRAPERGVEHIGELQARGS